MTRARLPIMPEGDKKTNLTETQRAGCSLFCALALAALSALFYISGDPVFRWAALVPALLALLMLVNMGHSLLARSVPATTLTVALEPLQRGQPAGVRIHQAGPVSLESLRVNLVCEVITRKGKQRWFSYPFSIALFEARNVEIGYGTEVFACDVTVPLEGEPTTEEPQRRVTWRLEVWGKVRRRADVMRPFEVEVV